MTRRQAALHGFGWGCIGGLALVALMYLANLILGLRPLPQLLNEPLLSLMPGFVFGFLIDNLFYSSSNAEHECDQHQGNGDADADNGAGGHGHAKFTKKGCENDKFRRADSAKMSNGYKP